MALKQNIKDMLNRLREKVRKIIEGKEKLLENESYAVAIARLMQLKETFITKISLSNGDYELKYDLDKGRTILRDLLFLYFCVVQRMEISYNQVNPVFEAALKNHQEADFVNEDGSLVVRNTCLITGRGVEKLEKEHAITFLDDPFLIDIIRNAVVVLDMIRNSFGHNNNGQNCYYDEEANSIKIKNDGGFAGINNIDLQSIKNYLDIDIPFEYISNFGEGIEARKEDSLAMELADLNASLISKTLKYSFGVFQRTKVDRLEYLYNIVSYDNSLLQELPGIVFSSSVPRSKLDYLFSRCDPEDFKRLPNALFCSRCTIERIIMLHNLGLRRANYYSSSNPLNKLDIDLIESLPDLIFTCSSTNLGFIEYLTDPVIHSAQKLLNPRDIAKLPRGIFYASTSRERVEYFVDHCNSIEEIFDLPDKAFSNRFSNLKLSYIVGEDNPDLSRLYNLPDAVFSHEFYLDKLKFFMGDDKDVLLLKDIPKELFDCCFTLDMIKKLLGNRSIKELKNYDFSLFKGDDDIQRLSNIMGKEVDLDLLNNIPRRMYDRSVPSEFVQLLLEFMNGTPLYSQVVNVICFSTFSFDNLKFVFNYDNNLSNKEVLTQLFSDVDKMNAITKITRFVFSSQCTLDRLTVVMGEDKDCSRLFYLNPLLFSPTASNDKIKLLMSSNWAIPFFTDVSNKPIILNLISSKVTESRIRLLCGNNLNFNVLKYVPDYVLAGVYSDEKLSYLLSKCGQTSALRLLPCICFRPEVSMDRITKLYDACDDFGIFCNLSPYLFDSKCIDSRIDHLLSLVDNDFKKMNELPKELFYCDDSMVDSLFETAKKNIEIEKNLFSHLNDESIALVVYMNALFSVLDKGNIDYALLDFNCLDTLTKDGVFEGKTHPDVVNNMNYLCSNLGNRSNFYEIVKTKGLSFTKMWDTKAIMDMSAEDVYSNYVIWENTFLGFFDDMLLDRLKACSERTSDNMRNASDHLRFIQLARGILGIYDEETKKNNNGVVQNNVSFAARTKIKDLFESLGLIHSQLVDNNHTKKNDLDKCMEHFVTSLGTGVQYSTLKNNLDTWTKAIIEKTRDYCMALYYLKQKPNLRNVSVVYGKLDYKLIYNDTGTKVVENVTSWYQSLGSKRNSEEFVEIESKFTR